MVGLADSYWVFCVLLLAPTVRTIWHEPKTSGHAGRRKKRKWKGLKRKSSTTALTSDTTAANPIGTAAKWETGTPINVPQAD